MAKEEGRAVDARTFEAESARAVAETVAQQVASGIDVVSDGEMSKLAYTLYVRHRVNGMGMDAAAAEKGRHIMVGLDRLDHPDYGDRAGNFSNTPFPACIGPVSYGDHVPLERDLAHLAAAVAKVKPVEAFMTAPSPGILTARHRPLLQGRGSLCRRARHGDADGIRRSSAPAFCCRSIAPISPRRATTSIAI